MRLYDETCLERWERKKREARRRAVHEDRERSRSEETSSFPSIAPSYASPSFSSDPSPSSFDGGGGSSGGGGADGSW